MRLKLVSWVYDLQIGLGIKLAIIFHVLYSKQSLLLVKLSV